jgi:hypothetical protein
MNTASNKLNITTEINEVFISTNYEIALQKYHFSKFYVNILDRAFIYDVQYFYHGRSKSFNDNNAVPDVFFDVSRPNRLMFDLKNILEADGITIKILTYEILENHLNIYDYQIPLDVAEESFEMQHELSISSDFGVKAISYSKNYAINQSSQHHIFLHSRNINTADFDDSLYITFEFRNKPKSLLYRYPKDNSDLFLLENSFYPIFFDDNNLHEIFFIIDQSKGITKKQSELQLVAINEILSKIRSIDKINMCVFSDKYHIFSSSSVYANEKNINKIIDFSLIFSPIGFAEIDKMMRYVASIPIPLGYSRSYFLFAGKHQYPLDSINDISKNTISSKLYLFQFLNGINKSFISEISKRNIADHFVINNIDNIDHFTRNFYNILNSGLITEIDFDFGETELTGIVDDQPVALPQYRTLYVAGETTGSITEPPSIRILIDGNELVSKCDKIIETHNDILKSYIESGAFKTTNPFIKKLRSSDEDKMLNKTTHIFDDVSNSEENAIVVNQLDYCNGLDFSVYCDHKMTEKNIFLFFSKNFSQFEDIFVKATDGLIIKEIIVLLILKSNSIKCDSIFFRQVEYDDKIEKNLLTDLRQLMESISFCIDGECKLLLHYCPVSP